jgi:hypothetical protein
MGEQTTYDAYLEVQPDGACLAQIVDLPGCFACGASEVEALAALAARIPAYYLWLTRHDEYTPLVSGPCHIELRERAAGSAHVCGSAAFFTTDAPAPTSEDLDWLLALLQWAYADLLDAAAHANAASEMDGILRHVAQAQWRELGPLTGEQGDPPVLSAGSGSDALKWALAECQTKLREATPESLEHGGAQDSRPWSVRWALRRGIVHARWHTEQAGGRA